MDTLRGWPIYKDGKGVWRFKDTDEPTVETWRSRSCGRCGEHVNGKADPCLGELPGVANACCGHGNSTQAYIQFNNGVAVYGFTLETDRATMR